MPIVADVLPRFTNTVGQPYVNATLYFGEPNVDTQANPITVYGDRLRATDLGSSVTTDAWGRPQFNGSHTAIHVFQAYSFEVYSGGVLIDQVPYAVGIPDLTSVTVTSIATLKGVTANDGDSVTVAGYTSVNDGGGGVYVFDADETAADNGGTVIAPTSGSGRWMLQHDGSVTPEQFGALRDDSNNDLPAITAALQTKLIVKARAGIYRIAGELPWDDGYKLVGAGSSGGIRTASGLGYDSTRSTIIKYSGAGGANSAAVRLSTLAVGIEATDLTAPDTDDLLDIRLENIHIDANGLAQFGLYCYRLVSCYIHNVSVEKSTEHGIFIGGCFTNTFSHLNAFNNEKNGITVGVDLFGWSSGEFAVNANYFITPVARDNGTGETYNESSNLTEGHGLYLQLNRANVFTNITAEGNDGAGVYMVNVNSNFGGPNKFVGGYLEANQTDAVADGRATTAYTLMVTLIDTMKNFEFDGVFINGSQDIYIRRTGNLMTDRDDFLAFKNIHSTVQIDIDSDTSAYTLERFTPYPSFSGSKPDNIAVSFTTAGATIKGGTLAAYSWVELTSTSASSTGALTLEDGEEGDEMHILMVADAGTSGVITDNSGGADTIHLGNASSITFDDVGDNALLKFTNGAWYFSGGTATVA